MLEDLAWAEHSKHGANRKILSAGLAELAGCHNTLFGEIVCF